MGTANNQFYFSEVRQKDQNEKLEEASLKKSILVVWERGRNEREQYVCVSYNPDNRYLGIHTDKTISSLINKKVCFHLEIDGVQYLGEGKFSDDLRNSFYYINLTNSTLYKWERRKNFRLKIPAGYKSILFIMTQKTDKSNNVIDITNINKMKLEEMGYQPFNVRDISASGVAISIHEIAKEWEINYIFDRVVLFFENQWFVIPKAKIVYHNAEKKKIDGIIEEGKMALYFGKLPMDLDRMLHTKIELEARKIDLLGAFEDHTDLINIKELKSKS